MLLYCINKLLENKEAAEEQDGIADLPILYDLYMMSRRPARVISGLPKEIAESNLEFKEKMKRFVKVAADTISYSDGEGGARQIDIGAISMQIWKERLLRDAESFAASIRAEDDPLDE